MRSRLATLLVLVLTSGCGFVTAPETHLIPEGYRGDVFIVSGMSAGEPPERSGLSIVFRIPANGVLVTQDRPSQGWYIARFYYVDAGGRRRQLQEEPSSVHDTAENRADTRPMVWFQRGWTMSGTDLPCPVKQYYVGTRAHLLSRDANADELRFRQYVKEHHVCP